MSQPPERPHRNFYGRRRGKHLRDSQGGLSYKGRPRCAVAGAGRPGTRTPTAAPSICLRSFGGREVWLEVGFGGGEHMVHQAGAEPDGGYHRMPRRGPISTASPCCWARSGAQVWTTSASIRAMRATCSIVLTRGVHRQGLPPIPRPLAQEAATTAAASSRPASRTARPRAETSAPSSRVATDIPDYGPARTREEVPRGGFEWLAEGAMTGANLGASWTRKPLRNRRRCAKDRRAALPLDVPQAEAVGRAHGTSRRRCLRFSGAPRVRSDGGRPYSWLRTTDQDERPCSPTDQLANNGSRGLILPCIPPPHPRQAGPRRAAGPNHPDGRVGSHIDRPRRHPVFLDALRGALLRVHRGYGRRKVAEAISRPRARELDLLPPYMGHGTDRRDHAGADGHGSARRITCPNGLISA